MKPFGTWLINYSGDDSVIRDLCNDFNADCKDTSRKPEDFATEDALDFRIRCLDGCPEAIEACAAAARLWRRDYFVHIRGRRRPDGTRIGRDD